MSFGIVVDMNLSVEWAALLTQAGWPTVHWSEVGDPRAEDSAIMAWALTEGRIVLTHDLDFGTALALTHAAGPSVLQVRGPRVLPEHIGTLVIAAIRKYEVELSAGALWLSMKPGRELGSFHCDRFSLRKRAISAGRRYWTVPS